MRPLADCSVFQKQKGVVERFDGKDYIVYSHGKNDWEELHWKHYLTMPKPLLYSTFCSLMNWNKHRYIHRINQPFLSIEYILEGELWFRTGGLAFIAEKGDLCLLHRQKNHDYYFQPGIPTRLATVVMHGQALTQLLQLLHLDRAAVFPLANGERFLSLFNRLKPYIDHNDQSTESGEINSGICFELLQFLGHSREPVPVPPEMEEIRTFLEDRCAEPLQMTDVAKRFHLSLPTLYRRFQQYFGTSPYHFRLEHRIRKAEELLTQTAMPVKEIAFLLGYAKALYFSAEFIRFRGISPREFRNRETAGSQPLPG